MRMYSDFVLKRVAKRLHKAARSMRNHDQYRFSVGIFRMREVVMQAAAAGLTPIAVANAPAAVAQAAFEAMFMALPSESPGLPDIDTREIPVVWQRVLVLARALP